MSHEFRHADFYDENNLRNDFQRRHPYISFVRLQELSNNIITESFVGEVNPSSTRCLFLHTKYPGVSSAEVWICPPATGLRGDLYGPGDPTKVRATF